MKKIYINDDPKSPISAIMPAPSCNGSLMDVIPRVELRDFKNEHNNSEIVFVPVKTEDKIIEHYIVKSKGYHLSTACTIVEALHQSKLVNDNFKDTVITTETKSYHEEMKIKNKRRVYEYPQDENSLIDAFIVQMHGGRFESFIRFKREKIETLSKACEKSSLGFDDMSSEFECFVVLFSYEKSVLTIPEALKKLCQAQIINEDFKNAVFKQEHTIPNTSKHLARTENTELLKFKLKKLCDVINYYCLISSKVKHGVFKNQSPRPLKQINFELTMIKDQECSIEAGLEKIIHIAEKMGAHHPISEAAHKCRNLILSCNKEQRIEINERVELALG